jgi:VIT1/CCC1 family predicted Fe2+/Mn2+ transporter
LRNVCTEGTAMTSMTASAEAVREPVLSPVDRISEILFGLLSFVGAVSVAEAGRAEVRAMFATALGCNLAWGLVDAVMYVVRAVTERGKSLTLLHSVRAAPDAQSGRALVERSLSKNAANLVSPAEIEAIRSRIAALSSVPARPTLGWNDLLSAVAVFLLVVAATFPVVLPFALMQDVGVAKNVSRVIALVMLFFGGLGLGRYAGYGSWRFGFIMAGLGTALVGAIKALGG